MKNLENIGGVLAIGGLFAGLLYMIFTDIQERDSLTAEQIELNEVHNQCISKVRGSRPACWTKRDWEIACEYFNCKKSF